MDFFKPSFKNNSSNFGKNKTFGIIFKDPRIINIIWLDGGHNGGKDIWPTDRQLLQSFMERNIRIHVRVTPYQVEIDFLHNYIINKNFTLRGAKL